MSNTILNRCKWLGSALILGLSINVMAHHSPSAYDSSKVISKNGTLTEFRLQNPHAIWKVDVKNDKGEVVNWVIEGNPPNWFRTAGVVKGDFDKGLKKTVTIFFTPALDGHRAVTSRKIQFPDGTFIQFGDVVY